jgi:small-conductance mechanosensitive channel
MNLGNFSQPFILWFVSRGLKIIGILMLAFLGGRLISAFICKLIKPIAKESSRIVGLVDRKSLKEREKTLEGVFISVTNVIIWTMALLMILPEFGINTTPLLAGSGLIGLAIGMGSTALIRDYLSGLFILLEDQFRVGEEIGVAGIRGKVKNLNLRRTVLEDEKGTIYYIPNGQIDKVSNFSRSKKS